MPRVLAIFLFLLLTAEDPSTYAGLLQTPLAWVEELLFQPSFLKLPLATYAEAVLLVALGNKGHQAGGVARPVRRAVVVAAVSMIAWAALGASRGGDMHQAGFQMFPYINGLLLAALLMAVLRTSQHYALVLRVIVAAATLRAVMAVLVYLLIVRNLPWNQAPEYVTSHHDTVLFVTALLILVAAALENVGPRARAGAAMLSPLLLLAIQLNNRRLAWVSLVFGLVALFAALPPSRAKRRVTRSIAALAPVLALYALVGWGRPERVFSPLRSLATVSSQKDASTLSRDYENDGLIFTFAQNGVLGTGFGHEYIETNASLSARVFPQYRFLPHNSLLGLLAFTGAFGIAGILLPVPLSVYYNARTCRLTTSPIARAVAAVGVAEVAVCMNQMYGDMGFGSRTTLVILATAVAAAGRLSAWSDSPSSNVARAPKQASPTEES